MNSSVTLFITQGLALLGGILTGIITGLLPGIHPNLIATLTALTTLEPVHAAVFLTAMAGTNTIFESISAALLVPDPDKAGSACQQFLEQHKAPDAARLLMLGATLGAIISLPSIFVILPLVKKTYFIIRPWLAIILACLSAFFIFQEKTWQKKIWAILVATSAGILGWIVLNNPFPEPLFLLLTGMYALPTLTQHVFGTHTIPSQRKEVVTSLSARQTLLTIVGGSFSAALLMLLPITSPSHAAYAAQPLARKPEHYLLLLGAINSADLILSLGAAYYLGKERNGVMATIAGSTEVTLHLAAFLGGVLLISIGISALLSVWALPRITALLEKTSYRTLSLSILLLILGITIWLTGWIGVVILVTAGAIGTLCQNTHVSHKHCMNALTVPVIGYLR